MPETGNQKPDTGRQIKTIHSVPICCPAAAVGCLVETETRYRHLKSSRGGEPQRTRKRERNKQQPGGAPGFENKIIAGWSSQVARQAHNLKVAGSNPAPATKFAR